MPVFILRAGQRATLDPTFAAYEPLSVSASGPAPDESVAPLELWEEVEDLYAELAANPFKLTPVVVEEPQE
jgi:hypothetical protein